MIIQSIALLDQMDKDINTFAMRVREWYSWHFPELKNIVKDNFQFAKCAAYIKVCLLSLLLSDICLVMLNVSVKCHVLFCLSLDVSILNEYNRRLEQGYFFILITSNSFSCGRG